MNYGWVNYCRRAALIRRPVFQNRNNYYSNNVFLFTAEWDGGSLLGDTINGCLYSITILQMPGLTNGVCQTRNQQAPLKSCGSCSAMAAECRILDASTHMLGNKIHKLSGNRWACFLLLSLPKAQTKSSPSLENRYITV